jgi:hypothetical protein
MCNLLTKKEPNKALMIITAPKGSSLQLKEEDEGCKSLILDASGIDKPIKAYVCRPNNSVQELNL